MLMKQNLFKTKNRKQGKIEVFSLFDKAEVKEADLAIFERGEERNPRQSKTQIIYFEQS